MLLIVVKGRSMGIRQKARGKGSQPYCKAKPEMLLIVMKGRSRKVADHADSSANAVNAQQIGGFWPIRVAKLQPFKGVSFGPLDLLLDQLWIIQQIDSAGI
jgi:hypothetical protein